MLSVSAIIPTHNYGRFVRDAIESVFAQTAPALEVIVVDDGSMDDTHAILESYGDRIRVIRQPHTGVSAARNAGVAAARGEYVAFLDSDDVWFPEKLAKQLARFENDPQLGLVHCGTERFDHESGRTTTVMLDGVEGWVVRDLLLLDRAIIEAGSSIVLPKRLFDEVGGFDSRMAIGEDWDLCFRIASRAPVGFVREPLVRYRQHGNGSHLRIDQMESGMMLALEKAFQTADPQVQSLRRHAYGRLHRILSGCYFRAHDPRMFLRHMFASLRCDPRNAAYFAAFPLRVVRRKIG